LWSGEVAASFRPDADVVIAPGDCVETLRSLPDGFAKLIITSPPYNIGKAYEKATALDHYLDSLGPAVEQIFRVLSRQARFAGKSATTSKTARSFRSTFIFTTCSSGTD